MDSFRIDAFTTKIGLSSGAVTVSSSLRDELTGSEAAVWWKYRQRLENAETFAAI